VSVSSRKHTVEVLLAFAADTAAARLDNDPPAISISQVTVSSAATLLNKEKDIKDTTRKNNLTMLNITGSRVVEDVNFRYKMPRMIAKTEGRGNGIKTVIGESSLLPSYSVIDKDV